MRLRSWRVLSVVVMLLGAMPWLVATPAAASITTPDGQVLSNVGTVATSTSVAQSGEDTFLVWWERPNIVFRKISANGTDPGPALTLGQSTSFTSLQVVASGSDVYVVWSNQVPVPGTTSLQDQVFLAASGDGGDTFFPPVQVSQSRGWYPRVAAAGNLVSVAWNGDGGLVALRSYNLLSDGLLDIAGIQTFGDGAQLVHSYMSPSNWPPQYDVAVTQRSSGEHDVFLAWENTGIINGQDAFGLRLSKSADGGKTFASNFSIQVGEQSWPRLVAAGDDVHLLWSDDQPDSHGNRYVTLGHAVSHDAGTTFGASQTLTNPTNACGSDTPNNYGYCNNYDIALSSSDQGANAPVDLVAIAWRAHNQIFMARSTDRGDSFGTPISVSDVWSSDAVRIAMSGGNVSLSWSGQAAYGVSQIVTFVATSQNFGASFDVSKISDPNRYAFNSAIAAYPGRYGIAWSQATGDIVPGVPIEVRFKIGTYPDNDLALSKAELVQAAEGSNKLVENKPTVVHVVVRNGFRATMSVPIRVTITGVDDQGNPVTRSVTETKALAPGDNDVFLLAQDPLKPTGDGSTLNFDISVDPPSAANPHGQFDESNETNNEITGSDHVARTQPLRILFVPVGVVGQGYPDCATMQQLALSSQQFISAAFPVDPAQVQFVAECNPETYILPGSLGDVLNDLQMTAIWKDLSQYTLTSNFDKVVGVVNPGWFQTHAPTEYKDAVALAPYGVSGTGPTALNAVIVESENLGGWATAHELAHNYGWVANGAPSEDPDHHHHMVSTAAPGYWVDKQQAMNGLIDWMYWSVQGANPALPTRWISSDTWDFLFKKLKTNPNDPDPPVLTLNGLVNPDGRLTLDPLYTIMSVPDVQTGASGEIMVDYLDASGATIASTGFDTASEVPDANPAPTGSTAAGFSVRVPLPEGTAAVRVRHVVGDQTVDQQLIQRSANAPTVSNLTPGAGASFNVGESITFGWTGADADPSSALSYNLFYSTDNGTTWLPLQSGVTATSFSVKATPDMVSDHVIFKVVAGDGFNSGEATSGAFAIKSPMAVNGQIVFESTPSSNSQSYQVFTMNPDGTGVTQLTPNRTDTELDKDRDPAWSADGKQIVFVNEQTLFGPPPDTCPWCNPQIIGSSQSLMVMNSAGLNRHVVLTGGQFGTPHFSPDASRIEFEGCVTLPNESSCSWGLYVINSDGTGLMRLVAPTALILSGTSWSPDGNLIAYAVRDNRANVYYDVYTIDPAHPATTNTCITCSQPGLASEGFFEHPVFSPDGSKIAVGVDSTVTGYPDGFWILQRNGTPIQHVLAGKQTMEPAWSPDGTKVVYTAGDVFNNSTHIWSSGLFVVDLATQQVAQLTTTSTVDETWPSWGLGAASGSATVTLPAANAGGPYTANEGSPVQLDASKSTVGSGSASYSWDLNGDGVFGDAIGATPTATFPDNGTFIVAVQVTDGSGNSAVADATVTVANAAPTVSNLRAVIDTSGNAGLTADVSDPGSGDTQMAVVAWGDGSSSTATVLGQGGSVQVMANHHYAQTGSYHLTLTVTDKDGAATPAATDVVALPTDQPPTAAGGSATTDQGIPVHLTLQASDPEGDPIELQLVTPPAHGQVVLQQPGFLGAVSSPGAIFIPDPSYAGQDQFSFVASDGRSRSAPATVTLTIRPSNTPPTAPGTPTLSAGGNPNQGLFTLQWTASSDMQGDSITYTLEHRGTVPGSSYTEVADGLTATSYTFSGSGEAEGAWTYRVKASDGKVYGNYSSDSSAVVVDKTPPSITTSSPANGAVFTLNQSVSANYSCQDTGSTVQSCTGPVANGTPIDTAAVGAKTFTVTATDAASNTTSQTSSYTVGYGITALYDQKQVKKIGSTIPIKVALIDAMGANVSSPGIVVQALTVDGTIGPVPDAGNANPTNSFRFDPTLSAKGGYIFNLKTTGMSAGTHTLYFSVAGDPTTHSVQFDIR